VALSVAVGWEKSPKREVTVGAPVGAYDVCDVRSGGREGRSLRAPERLSKTVGSRGCIPPVLRGENVDIVDGSFGRGDDPAWGELEPLMSSDSLSFSRSFIIKRTKLRTRRTILPTTISRGCAAMRRCPTERIRSNSFAASLLGNSPTTLRRSSAVARAHGRELRICRRLRRLSFVSECLIAACRSQQKLQRHELIFYSCFQLKHTRRLRQLNMQTS
jgi:hypothetical protein